jgi:hypothetical protein
LGSIPDNALLGGPLTGGDPAGASWILGANMTNLAGVNDNPADDSTFPSGSSVSKQVQNARTATTGFELLIPRTQIGLPADPVGATTIHLLALLTGTGPFRDISNQILPAGLGGGIAPFLVTGPVDAPTDLTQVTVNGQVKSYQCLTVNLGLCNQPRFDADGDGDVDQEDFAVYQRCYTGITPNAVTNACRCFDWDLTTSDGFIDLADYAAFQRCVSGPYVPANPTCDMP